MLLGKEEILGVSDLAFEDVDVSEWGGMVRIGVMTGTERDAYEATLRDKNGKPDMSNFRAKLLSCCIKGEDGERMFSAKDIDALGKKSARALDRLTDIALDLNGMKPSSVEEAAKNSGSGQGDTFTSTLPASSE